MKTTPLLTVFLLFCVTALAPAQTTLYWYPSNSVVGGSGTWTVTNSWSTSSGTKAIFGALPTNTNNVVFTGTAGTVSVGAATLLANDLSFDSGGYIISSTTSYTVSVNSLSGSGLSNTTFVTSGNAVITFDISRNTSFNGTIARTTVTGAASVAKIGSGTLNLTGATITAATNTGAFSINGGTLWLDAKYLSSNNLASYINLAGMTNTSGLLTVVGDGSTSSLTRALGTGVGQINWGTSNNTLAGFGARGNDLVINFGGTNAEISNLASFARAVTKVLGTTDSDRLVKLENGVSLSSSATNFFRSDNGSAAIDGEMSGRITASSADTVMAKTGDGVMRLSGNSTNFNGRLDVQAGTVLIDGTHISSSTNTTYGINVATGATLGGDGLIALTSAAAGAAKLNVSGTLMAGREGSPGQSLTISNTALTLLSGSVLSFGLGDSTNDTIVRLGSKAWSFDSNQRIQLFDERLSLVGSTNAVRVDLIYGLASDPGVTNWQSYNSSINFNVNSFGYDSGVAYAMVVAIPEPQTLALIALSGVFLILVRRCQRRRRDF